MSIVSGQRRRDTESIALAATGMAYFTAGQYRLSVDAFSGAIESNPANLNAHTYLGLAHFDLVIWDAKERAVAAWEYDVRR